MGFQLQIVYTSITIVSFGLGLRNSLGLCLYCYFLFEFLLRSSLKIFIIHLKSKKIRQRNMEFVHHALELVANHICSLIFIQIYGNVPLYILYAVSIPTFVSINHFC